MKTNNDILRDTLHKIIGLEINDINLGHGSFVTIDFGKTIEIKIVTKKREKTFKRGEWHLWIYMCAWRIDKIKLPFVGSNDPRDVIEAKLKQLKSKKLKKFIFSRNTMDVCLKFEDGFSLFLFNCNTIEGEHWMLFTPDQHVFSVGPGSKITYEFSSKV